MTTYHYALYDDNYYGFHYHHSARNLKNALAGLRKLMIEKGFDDAGVIATEKIPNGRMARYPKGYVGTMNERFGRGKITVTAPNGRKVKVPNTEYIWFGKGKRKGQKVMSDGTLRAWV